MGKHTALLEQHKCLGAQLVDFSGWEMPLHYGSQLKEHQQVREHAGLFDVSHMRAVDLKGPGVFDFLQKLLCNDIAKLKEDGKALYGVMLNEQGGIIDDLITYRVSENHYRIVINCGTTDKDLAWFEAHKSPYDVSLTPREDLAILAVQGPKAREIARSTLALPESVASMKPFHCMAHDSLFIARTGYTGEDGFELMVPNDEAPAIWKKLIDAGVAPIGLGARDTLRLEAGLNLYGQDMDESNHPYESNLAWTVAMNNPDRDFIGRDALLAIKEQGTSKRLVGLVLQDRGVLRPHQTVLVGGQEAGMITSGTFSPSLQKSIAFARLSDNNERDCLVQVRQKQLAAQIVKPAFVKHGKIII